MKYDMVAAEAWSPGSRRSGLFAQLYMYVCERGSKCTALFERRLSV